MAINDPLGDMLTRIRNAQMRGKSVVSTPGSMLRQRVLELVARSERPVKAYDLLDQVREGEGSAAPPTVYLALDFLLANGFIHKLESINASIRCHHPRVQHSVPFLICDRCQRAVELEDEEVTRLLNEQAAALGFRPQAQTLEVHGICADCGGEA